MKQWLFILLVALTISGCNKKGREPSPQNITASISFELSDEFTKGGIVIHESEIANLNILIYDTRGNLSYYKYVEGETSSPSIEVGDGNAYTIYVLGNIGDITHSTAIRNLEGIKRFTTIVADGNSLISSQGNIPLSGYIDYRTIHNNDIITLPLTRAISKFRIIVNKDELSSDVSKFDITKVEIKNLNRRITYFIDSKAADEDDIIVYGLVKSGDELTNIYTSGVDFYISENMQGDLISHNIDEKTHIPPTDKMGVCTYIQITVDYRSNTQYSDQLIYRYYLHDGRFLDNFDIKRNTLYTCKTWFKESGINENSWRIDPSSMKLLVTGIDIDPPTYTFRSIGEAHQFSATTTPQNAENNSVTWSSTNPNIATVSPNGWVTAISDGNTTIKASANDGSGITKSATICVNTVVSPTSISITPNDIEIYKGETILLSAEVLPANANNKNVLWSSNDPNIATVNSSGTVTAIQGGNCIITATTEDGGISATAQVKVRERGFTIERIPILYPNYNSPYTIQYSAAPNGTPNFTLTKLSGEDCLFLSGNTLTANYSGDNIFGDVGEYRLMGSLNGINQTEHITVSLGQISISAPQFITLGLKGRGEVSSLTPSGATVRWESSNPMVATISNSGEITTHNSGLTLISGISATGAKSGEVVEVVAPTISAPDQITIAESRSAYIPYSTSPISVKDSIRWVLINGDEHISIDEDGLLSGILKSDGYNATVRARYIPYPSIYKDVSVKVTPALTLSSSNGKLLNTNFTTSDVDGYPTAVNIILSSLVGGPTEWLLYDSAHTPIPFNNYFQLSPSGILTPKSGTQGRFYLKGKRGNYYSNEIEIKVYIYLEYALSMFIHSYDKEKYQVTGEYEVFTSWSDPSWERISGNNSWLNLFLHDHRYHLLKYDDYYGYTLMTKPNNNPIEIGAINPYFFEYDPIVEPHPENNLARHLIPCSLLKFQNGAERDGVDGIAVEDTGGFFYVRQSRDWKSVSNSWSSGL